MAQVKRQFVGLFDPLDNPRAAARCSLDGEEQRPSPDEGSDFS